MYKNSWKGLLERLKEKTEQKMCFKLYKKWIVWNFGLQSWNLSEFRQWIASHMLIILESIEKEKNHPENLSLNNSLGQILEVIS